MRPYPGQARPQNSPKSPSVAKVPLTVVGHTLVLTLLVANAQCAETGLRVSPRGTALAKEFICGERPRASALPPGVETRGLSTQQAPQLGWVHPVAWDRQHTLAVTPHHVLPPLRAQQKSEELHAGGTDRKSAWGLEKRVWDWAEGPIVTASSRRLD